MTRRLLGPVGGPVAFFLVAALALAGLGWVTYAALRVEEAQREAAARAEFGQNLRVALRDLEIRMLAALAVEDSRPYYHYAPPDPALTPLLNASLPDWMKLHFRLDPAGGWSSPLVVDPETANFVRAAWEASPRNLTAERSVVLDELKASFPARPTHDLFAATDRSIPADSLSLAAPIVAGDVQSEPEGPPAPQVPAEQSARPSQPPVSPQAPAAPDGRSTADPAPDTLRVLGLELCLRGERAGDRVPAQDAQQLVPQAQKKFNEGGQAAGNSRAVSQAGTTGRGGRLSQKDARDNEKQVQEWFDRAGLIDRAIREAKNAAEFQMPRGQLYNSLGQNYVPGLDPRNSSNTANPGAGGFQGLPQGPGPAPPGPGGPGGSPGTGNGEGEKGASPDKSTADSTKRDPKVAAERDRLRALDSRDPIVLATGLSAWFTRQDETRLRAALDGLRTRQFESMPERDKSGHTGAGPATVTPAAPLRDEAHPATPPLPAPPAGQPLAIHLGSMRPQWLTAPDGSDVLVLVRSANVDGRVVYQGVVVDWPKLEADLKEVCKTLFPDARLLPVKEGSVVYPERAMSALPVQLDPGPEPGPPPAGWTPLRIGLVLAWVAVIIAFVAVGFAGWSLIDLAERRIRFVSAVTHELRTPLTSLRLYLDLLVSGMIQDEEKRREYLGTLAVESDRLHRLIDNVLDFAKLEKRKTNGDVKPVCVNELVEQLKQTWADRVAQDAKELVVVSTLPADRAVNTDPAMVQQIVGNLIDNARKYTRDAADRRIWVWAKCGAGDSVVIEVEDRGPGVPPAERKSIFKPFRRGEQADSRAGGAGLGLALAKSWAEVLGGSLSYRPADGGTGACFRLELPGK